MKSQKSDSYGPHNNSNQSIKTIRFFKQKKSSKSAREISLFQGSVWGVPDTSVPFDGTRKYEDYKQALRPVLTLKTPESFGDYDSVLAAPGTSKYHKKTPKVLIAEVPPENLKQTTYFLLEYSWFSVQKNFQKKISELSTRKKNELISMLEDSANE